MIVLSKPFWKQFLSSLREDEIPRKSAALAYYSLFALAPLAIIITSIGGLFVGEEAVRVEVIEYLQRTFGVESRAFLDNILSSISDRTTSTVFLIIGLTVVVFGTTNLFDFVRKAFSDIFHLPEDKNSMIARLIKKHTLAFLYLAVSLTLLSILVLGNIAANISGDLLSMLIPGYTVQFFHSAASLGIIILLLGVIYRLISDLTVSWQGSFLGALIATFLFILINALFSLYIDLSITISFYGAASFVLALLLWVYYAGHILFIGAEFAKTFSAFQHVAESTPPSQEKKDI